MKRRKGFLLVESLMGMWISIILLSTVFSLLLLMYVFFGQYMRQSDAQNNVKAALLTLSLKTRNASTLTVQSSIPPFTAGTGAFFVKDQTLLLRETNGSMRTLVENVSEWNVSTSPDSNSVAFSLSLAEDWFAYSFESSVHLNNISIETQSGTVLLFTLPQFP
ncbi:MAG TPA: hypothetical protein P5560_13925 [Thermotogota bacterium]|nr:hypothetical protein [Thermotogota bacterium]